MPCLIWIWILCLSGSMVWWPSVGRRDQDGEPSSRTSTPGCEPGRGCRPTPAPALPLVAGATLPPRPPRSAPAPSATSATPVTPLLPRPPQGTCTRPRPCPRRPRWLRFPAGLRWLCPQLTSASSPSTDTPSPPDTPLFLPTSPPLLRPPGWSSTTCHLPKAARPAAPAAPPARVTSAACPPPRAPTTTPTRRCSPTASCRAAAGGRFRCTDNSPRRGWDTWTTGHTRRRCSRLITKCWCTTRSSPQTCRRTDRRTLTTLGPLTQWPAIRSLLWSDRERTEAGSGTRNTVAATRVYTHGCLTVKCLPV